MAVNTGRIPTVKVGRRLLIDPAAADPAWLANTDVRSPRNSVTGVPHAGSKNGHAPPSAASNLNAQRAERESWQAKLARLDYERKAGLLVRAEDREREGFEAGRAVRDAVLQVAKDISTDLAPAMTPLDVERSLTVALRGVLARVGVAISRPEPGEEPVNGSPEPAA